MRNILTPSWFSPSRLFPMLLLVMLVILAACGIAPPPPDKTVYIVSETGTVYAVKGTDGSMLWQHHMAGDNGSVWGASSGLALVNGIIYTSSSVDGGYVYAFRARDGMVLWHTRIHPEGTPSAPVLVNGVIYVAVADPSLTSSNVYALKAADGAVLWHSHIKGCGSSPTVVNNTLYLSADVCSSPPDVAQQGYVYALDASSGSLRWRYQAVDSFISQVVVLNNIAYADEISGTIDAIHANNGSLLWQHRVQRRQLSAVAGVNDSLYVSAAGFLYAFRASDGAQLWKVHVGDHGPYEPTVIGNTIYAASPLEENIYALQTRDGASLWTYQAQSYFTGAEPIVMDGVLYFSMNDGVIYALTSNDGAQIYRYDTPGPKLVTSSSLAVGP